MTGELNLIGPDGTPAQPGPDHSWFGVPSPPDSGGPTYPDGRVAVSVVIDLGAAEWEHLVEPTVPPSGGRGVAPPPDYPRMSHREFGHRVGVFRLLRILDEVGIVPAAAVDVLTVEHYPTLVDHLGHHVGEFVAHGLSASRPLTSLMATEEERDYIGLSIERLSRRLPERPGGWLGPEHGESAETPRLLAEAGLRYVLDWGNDEAPYRMSGADPLWSVPLSWELSDLAAGFTRNVEPRVYARSLLEAFEVLASESPRRRRMLSLHLHPWISGQAFRARPLLTALEAIMSSGRAVAATPGQVVRWHEMEAP